MKQNEVVMGGKYTCYVCGVQAPVIVVGTKAPNSFSRFTRFVVRRVGESVNLPKPRSAAALRALPPTRCPNTCTNATPCEPCAERRKEYDAIAHQPTPRELFPDLDPSQ